MDVLHVSLNSNREKILKEGVKRRPPFLDQFTDLMVTSLKGKYSKKNGLVFTFPEACPYRDKYLRDFVYWKVWGHPRNLLLDKLGLKDMDYMTEWADLKEKGPTIFNRIIPREEEFVIFKINLNNELIVECLHGQYTTMSPLWSDMDSRYEHNDKPLVLVNEDIEPQKIKVIGRIQTIVSHSHRVDVILDI